MSTTLHAESGSETEIGLNLPVELRRLDQQDRILDAHIKRVSPALFEIGCTERLDNGQRLTLSHEGRRVEVAVSSCLSQGPSQYAVELSVVSNDPGEVRSELRLPTDLSAFVTVAGRSEEIPAKVVDMSPSGMGLETRMALQRGAKVCINLEQGLAFGEIRFCRRKTQDVFFAGFLLEEYIGRET